VVLSLDAQAKVLEQQGMSVDEIANQLGIAPAVVQTDLGITVVSTQTKAAKA
jgi:transposase